MLGLQLDSACNSCMADGTPVIDHVKPLILWRLLIATEAPGAAALPRSQLAHIQQLLAQYEAEERGGAGPSTATTSITTSSTAGGSSAGPGGGEGGEAGEAWGGEGYEEDAARGVTRAYLKFSKRLGRAPTQCAR